MLVDNIGYIAAGEGDESIYKQELLDDTNIEWPSLFTHNDRESIGMSGIHFAQDELGLSWQSFLDAFHRGPNDVKFATQVANRFALRHAAHQFARVPAGGLRTRDVGPALQGNRAAQRTHGLTDSDPTLGLVPRAVQRQPRGWAHHLPTPSEARPWLLKFVRGLLPAGLLAAGVPRPHANKHASAAQTEQRTHIDPMSQEGPCLGQGDF